MGHNSATTGAADGSGVATTMSGARSGVVAETIVKDGFLGSTSRRRRGRGSPASTPAASDRSLARPIARFDAASSLRPGRPAVTWHHVGPDEIVEVGGRDADRDGNPEDRSPAGSPPNRTPAHTTQRHVPGWLVAILALVVGMAISTVVHRGPEPPSADELARQQACSQALDAAKERALLSVTRGAGETRMLVAVNENNTDEIRAELDRLSQLREQDVEKGQRFNELRTRCER